MTNPYKASHQPIEPKPRSLYLEVMAIAAASLPAALWLFVYTFLKVCKPRSAEVEAFGEAFVIVNAAIALTILIIWSVSGIYNLRGALKGRLTGYMGLLANVVSFAIWFVLIVDGINAGEYN
jgi:hypothetical protein